jgi:Enoyl-(Acyl carrier protein) reductase
MPPSLRKLPRSPGRRACDGRWSSCTPASRPRRQAARGWCWSLGWSQIPARAASAAEPALAATATAVFGAARAACVAEAGAGAAVTRGDSHAPGARLGLVPGWLSHEVGMVFAWPGVPWAPLPAPPAAGAKSCGPVRVNAVAPGLVETSLSANLQEQHAAVAAAVPLHRSAHPQDCAEAVIGLLRNAYVTGHVMVVDGGTPWRGEGCSRVQTVGERQESCGQRASGDAWTLSGGSPLLRAVVDLFTTTLSDIRSLGPRLILCHSVIVS